MASNAKNLAEYLNNQTTSATADIADGSITSAKLASGAAAANIGTGAITTAKLAADAVTAAKLADDSVVTANIVDGNVTAVKTTGVGKGKNIIINGAMQVAQRSTSVAGIGASAGYFTVDRFNVKRGNLSGRLTMSQDNTTPEGFMKSLKLDCTTADAGVEAGQYFMINHNIEGQHLQHLKKGTSNAEKVTVSFYAKGTAKTYVCEFDDSDNNRHNSIPFTVSTSWTRHTFVFIGDTTGAFSKDNGLSGSINIWLSGGTSFSGGTYTANTWASRQSTDNTRAVGVGNFFDNTSNELYITGLQMEVGDTATEFDHTPIEETLRRCQRYYHRAGGSNYANIFGVGGIANTTGSWFGLGYVPVPMRAGPTLIQSGGTPRIQNGQAGYNASSISMSLQSTNGTGLSAGCNASGLTLYRWHNMDAGASAALFELDAEL